VNAIPSSEAWLDRGKPNALNFFRLIFAGMVVFSHAYTRMGEQDPLLRMQSWSLGSVAVDGFFIVSGFLIVGSWCSPSNTADRFLRNRILRIFPGFVVAILFSIAITAAAAWPRSMGYLKSLHVQSMLLDTLTLHHKFLDTDLAFPNLPSAHIVNGSLWTIPPEFCCYLAVALVGSLGLLRRGPVLVALVVSLLFYAAVEIRIGLHHGETELLSGSNPWRFASCFGAGGAFFIFRRVIPRSLALAGFCVVALVAALFASALQLAIPVFGAYLLFYAAFGLPEKVNAIGSKNDISYGIYLYASPIQQVYALLAFAGYLPVSSPANALIAGSVAVGAGWLSWKYVESPFLVRAHGRVAASIDSRFPTNPPRAALS
jgi:peptidoglycan/LPS O-acetylase OafA/YrhL